MGEEPSTVESENKGQTREESRCVRQKRASSGTPSLEQKKAKGFDAPGFAILTVVRLRLRLAAHCDLTLKGNRLLIIGIDCHRAGGIFPRLAEVTLFQKYAA